MDEADEIWVQDPWRWDEVDAMRRERRAKTAQSKVETCGLKSVQRRWTNESVHWILVRGEESEDSVVITGYHVYKILYKEGWMIRDDDPTLLEAV